jgi:hypothetical protein
MRKIIYNFPSAICAVRFMLTEKNFEHDTRVNEHDTYNNEQNYLIAGKAKTAPRQESRFENFIINRARSARVSGTGRNSLFCGRACRERSWILLPIRELTRSHRYGQRA